MNYKSKFFNVRVALKLFLVLLAEVASESGTPCCADDQSPNSLNQTQNSVDIATNVVNSPPVSSANPPATGSSDTPENDTNSAAGTNTSEQAGSGSDDQIKPQPLPTPGFTFFVFRNRSDIDSIQDRASEIQNSGKYGTMVTNSDLQSMTANKTDAEINQLEDKFQKKEAQMLALSTWDAFRDYLASGKIWKVRAGTLVAQLNCYNDKASVKISESECLKVQILEGPYKGLVGYVVGDSRSIQNELSMTAEECGSPVPPDLTSETPNNNLVSQKP